MLYLPLDSSPDTVRVLSMTTLKRQRWHGVIALRGVIESRSLWLDHPWVRMWKQHEEALAAHVLQVSAELEYRVNRNDHEIWQDLTIRDMVATVFGPLDEEPDDPPWMGWSDMNISHQSALVRSSEFYAKKFVGVPDNLPLVWPV